MVGARVNGKLVTIDYVIQNGDRIEIITSQNSKGPSRDWLKIVKSTQAKNKILQWFKQERKEDNIVRGKELLQTYCKAKGLVFSDLVKPEYTAGVMAAVGHGGLKEGQIVNKLLEGYEKEHKKSITDQQIMEEVQNSREKMRIAKSKSGITVKGIDDVAVRFSKCCSPVPGDEIVGFVTRGRGVSIHRTDCVNILNLPESERARLIDAEWQQTDDSHDNGLYMAEIKIFANNRTGLLVDITRIFTERKIDVSAVSSRTSKQGLATISMEFQVPGKATLNYLIDKIRQVESVIDIERSTG